MTDRQKLAKKQKRVLGLLEGGKSPSQVAKTLKISVNGVYGHMRRIEAKGYTVPRSGAKPTTTRKAKASTNGKGPVPAIDAAIADIHNNIDKRMEEIAKETLQIKGETSALEERTKSLLAESEALGKRRNALAAATA